MFFFLILRNVLITICVGCVWIIEVIEIQILFQIKSMSCSTVKPVVIDKKGVSTDIKNKDRLRPHKLRYEVLQS